MNRRFILVSMLAAAMFATSCSKDENNDKEINKPQVEVQKTRPITIKATNKSGISKVALGTENGDNSYKFQFEVGETMTITSVGDNPITYTLTLVDGAGTNEGTFSGNINEEDYYETFTASITNNELSGVSGAYPSLEAAVDNNYKFVSSEEFKLTDETAITLQDQYVYIGLDIEYLYGKSLNINNAASITLNQRGTTWVALPSGSLNIPDLNNLSTTVSGGNYYTITRTNAQKPTAARPTIANSTFDIASATTINLSNDAITTDMEYSTDYGNTWYDVTSSEINGLAANDEIKIRVKGNDYLNASAAATVDIPIIEEILMSIPDATIYYLEGDTWETAANYTVNSSISVAGANIIITNDGSIYKLQVWDSGDERDVSPDETANFANGYSWEYVSEVEP